MGERSALAARATLHVRSVLAPGVRVPIGWVAVGRPEATLHSPDDVVL